MVDAHSQCSHPPEIISDDTGEHLDPHRTSQDLTVTSIKVANVPPMSTNLPVLVPDTAASLPTTSQPQEPSDDTSIHSLPITASQSPTVQTPTADPSPEPTNRLITHIERSTSIRNNRRSVMDTRPSNRISGFWSSLMHRRDTITPSSSRASPRDDRPHSPDPVQSDSISRSPSPTPARPLTPPPSLSPPTLQELGLSLSVLTSDLSPSHFTTPPTSGTFMAPHYLLLCHAQGLDVLPLISPPAAHPYALVRRVSFKSVVVMEHRGVLVAIAGRRDGVRVYALEEVKKAVEWRMEVETRREREKSRREESKRVGSGSSSLDQRDSTDAKVKTLTRTGQAPKVPRKSSLTTSSVSTAQKMPRPPTLKPAISRQPIDQPPPYSAITEATRPRLQAQASTISINLSRSRRSSLSHVVVPPVPLLPNLGSSTEQENPMAKNAEWLEASDDEAIDMLTAGASGSQALDERTSTIPPIRISDTVEAGSTSLPVRSQATYSNRRRPANLDLTLAQPNVALAQPPEPSPTLLTIRQALQSSLPNIRTTPPTPASPDEPPQRRPAPDIDLDDDDDDGAIAVVDRISLAQALLESRAPDLPPAGSMRPQAPIMIGASPSAATVTEDGAPFSPSLGDGRSSLSRPSIASRPERRRRRWSVLAGLFNGSGSYDSARPNVPTMYDTPLGSPTSPTSPTLPIPEIEERPLTRSTSTRSRPSEPPQLAPRPSTSGGHSISHAVTRPPLPTAPPTPSHSRLIPRIISNAFSSRRSDERPPTLVFTGSETEKKNAHTPATPLPPPKLDYVKLPGTKGSLIIKAVETPKKSFLAILCGDNGEKVELFAGTYRTALGLSRTFILPDSPRSLELQLQGDDLVEVFLVFSQNVFGLEPATVRVREVRIGRAERRAARRRVREIRSGQPDVFDTDPQAQDDEDTNIIISNRLSLPSGDDPSRNNSNANLPDASQSQSHTPTGSIHGAALAHAEELVALASAPLGPYTTFQQLSYAPKLPLATIADDYIIPPTYPDFLDYRAEHEPDAQGNANVDLASIQFSPPGLPMPAPAPPSRWFYRDPKGVVHGPWKASLMQAWYKDGLLPPDLPVRKEDDKEFMLLKDLRQQCVDPSHPFRSAPPPSSTQHAPSTLDAAKPLLPPISLLVQPRHFGPPALFFSSRGGHSTSIVDARGRAVLKGRFVWSVDNDDDSKMIPRMGDVKRVEAFDVKDRSVLVAMRQGGLEAMDFGDALLKPADESRTLLPQFAPPPSNINRRGPFVWKIGTPIASSTSGAAALSSKTKASGYLGRKPSHTTGKSPAKAEFNGTGDGDGESTDEVLFLGRQGDEVYICERNTGAFRILRLCPDLS
ncbi:hypothetical protein DFH29DRAFT_890173 [Suillus ampliporus]|nr:hypothetical protein DFH29DRAFT_890173 [Suillus ampliporus]